MDIKQLIGETTDYDKKLALEEKKPKSWCKSISAFANCYGGKLIFGVSNDNELVGLADLKAAGLSPTLAAGSSAGAGSVVSTSAPQKKSDLESYLALASVGTALAQQQKAQTEADIAKNQLIQDKMDTEYYKKRGISPVESQTGYKQLLTNILNGFFNPIVDGASSSLFRLQCGQFL